MKTYTIKTEDFEPTNTLTAYKITYPTGHYMGNPLTPTTIVSSRPHKNLRCHGVDITDADRGVTCDPIRIKYPDVVDGYLGEATLVVPDKARIMGILTGMFARGEAQ